MKTNFIVQRIHNNYTIKKITGISHRSQNFESIGITQGLHGILKYYRDYTNITEIIQKIICDLKKLYAAHVLERLHKDYEDHINIIKRLHLDYGVFYANITEIMQRLHFFSKNPMITFSWQKMQDRKKCQISKRN